MSIPRIVGTEFGGADTAPLLLLGPSLGTSAATFWSAAAAHLSQTLRVVGWDLPGHGRGDTADAFTIAELAAAVVALADEFTSETFHYAGDSVGGCVGLQLLLDAPHRIASATLLCTGAAIGTPDAWRERAAIVRSGGTETMVAAAAQRWFPEGFADREPVVSSALLEALRSTDSDSYARVCEALAEFDVVDRLHEITTPVLAVAGSQDIATPPDHLQRIATGVKDGRLVVLDGVGHLAPAEVPARVAALIAEHASTGSPKTIDEVYAGGLAVRRDVLGDAHVERAIAATTDFTADFQRFITEYAWGAIWTRPGLDRRSRSLITLTALVARGHHEELEMHLLAARRNGLSNDEIKELLMQTAIYCGVPDANTAFRIAADVLPDFDDDMGERP
ncbi:4-carboxymuconolactone decarboxylase [Mycobacterium lehmannii]|uniref:bifunctional 3-oxoadipate enol-lactonase/4-carboxymuconolactone decarboxylase PcaDC n=1 Tax=Mycobacterium lehmannii TaxID=2048550 RepID=UPI000B93EF9A|nr:4-carboxymuconolactone decarboxylase [Mycobacterium lehmannii]